MRRNSIPLLVLAHLAASCAQTAANDCPESCASWQSCSRGECVLAAGFCASNADCPERCDLSQHRCVAASGCEPRCETWQVCEQGSCHLGPGFCESSVQCPDPIEDCDLSTHTCAITFATPFGIESFGAVIVTSETLRPAFEELAELHTLTGTPTDVVTTDTICEGACHDADPRTDTARAIKDYLIGRDGIDYVLLGGDIEHVPSRFVYDEFTDPLSGGLYAESFFTDYYYGDLSEWDHNGDGVYADDGHDSPDLRPELGVARLPVSDLQEAERAVTKVLSYLTAYNIGRIGTVLFSSNVATTINIGVPIDIDGGHYFEASGGTCSLFPGAFARDKLYALGALTAVDASELSVAAQMSAFETGYNVIVHSGHGSTTDLTTEVDGTKAITGDMVYGLANDQFPILLSCACEAGAFDARDSAGEDLVNAPEGGAIGYLGNTAIGLGLAGGSQLIDEVVKHLFEHQNVLIGEALRAAHISFSHPDGMVFPVVGYLDTVTADSYEWTQKAAVYLGDHLIPLWSEPATLPAPAISITQQAIPGGASLTLTLSPDTAGTVMLRTGSSIYRIDMTGTGPFHLAIPEEPDQVTVGFRSDTTLYAYAKARF